MDQFPIISSEMLDRLHAAQQQNLLSRLHLNLSPSAAGAKNCRPKKQNSWSCLDTVNQTFVASSHQCVELRRKRGMEVHQKICNDGHATQVTAFHAKGHQIFQDPLSQSCKGDQDENQLKCPASSFWSVDSWLLLSGTRYVMMCQRSITVTL